MVRFRGRIGLRRTDPLPVYRPFGGKVTESHSKRYESTYRFGLAQSSAMRRRPTNGSERLQAVPTRSGIVPDGVHLVVLGLL